MVNRFFLPFSGKRQCQSVHQGFEGHEYLVAVFLATFCCFASLWLGKWMHCNKVLLWRSSHHFMPVINTRLTVNLTDQYFIIDMLGLPSEIRKLQVLANDLEAAIPFFFIPRDNNISYSKVNGMLKFQTTFIIHKAPIPHSIPKYMLKSICNPWNISHPKWSEKWRTKTLCDGILCWRIIQ